MTSPPRPSKRSKNEALQERLKLVGEAGALEAERLRLIQKAAGEEIARTSGDASVSTEASHRALETVSTRLEALENDIAAIDREIAGQ
ncbi:hypothetical protein [Acuticoccus sediminis]|uniref:hypothetical protein n=1 Tax=Acuticoccus sediminis TaxID=2184697 RepID=UPI001CFDD81F|nr:hypothetical protein [Acuticoccus sediminis]